MGPSRNVPTCPGSGSYTCSQDTKSRFLMPLQNGSPREHASERQNPYSQKIGPEQTTTENIMLGSQHLFPGCEKGPLQLGNEKCARTFLHKLFEHPQGSGTSRQNSRDIPDSSLRNPRKTNFRGRARTFRPPPLRVEDPHPTGRSPDPKS